MMDQDLLDLLRRVDTPTVLNAIEVAEGKRGYDRFTRGTLLASAPHEPAIVGHAVTAKISGLKPSPDPQPEVRTRRMDYYRMMAEAPKPAVAVIEDVDHPDCIAAYWGEVNAVVHKGFGLAGTLTNGVMRDLGDVPDGYPILAGSIGPSHGFVHVVANAVPVTVFGLTVAPGDLVHADRHGAVVVPPEVVPALAAAIRKLQETEALVLGPARQPGFDFAAFERAWTAFENART
jgi:regulator of RNase E activity RraA